VREEGARPGAAGSGGSRAWRRRLVTIPAVTVAGLVLLAAAPLWIPVCALLDVLRPPPRAALRCGLFATWFAWCEIVGLLVAGTLIAASRGARAREAERLYALQRLWAAALFGGARRIFGFRVVVDGAEDAAVTPVLLFMRHASIADTLLPAALVGNVHGTRLRYVIKRELLFDPCLDVVGNRLPNYFVDRFAEDSTGEIAEIRALGEDLGPGDGVIIYPEGTRFTEAKRRRILARLRREGDIDGVARAECLERVLPPRYGGALALLDAAPRADVLIGAHTGFEAAATFPSLWRGELVGRTVRVCFWRIPRRDVPKDARERSLWLYDQWLALDAWVAEQEAAETGTSPTARPTGDG